MFAPNGYRDLSGIIKALNRDVEGRLHFPTLDEVEVDHLAWLAWSYGELDFIEEVVFRTALELGLFACSPEGRVLRLSENPLLFSAASATDMLDATHNDIAMAERISQDVSPRKDKHFAPGVDPWAESREGGYRIVPMCFSRSGYILSLRNFDAYIQWLREVGYNRLSEFPFLKAGFADVWRAFEGHSLCIEDASATEYANETIWKQIQYSIYSTVWDNADEMYSDLLLSGGAKDQVIGKINVETRAFIEGERLLADSTYLFRTLDKLRSDIGISKLGERAWRRVVDILRSKHPHISTPGRKS